MANNTSHCNNDTSNRNGNTKPIEKPITQGAELNPSPIKLKMILHNNYKTTHSRNIHELNELKIKNMYYKKQQPGKTTLHRNTSYEGETIEKKINRIVNNKEPIKDGAPIIYTDRREGVKPEYDIKTDRFELAIDATDHINKTHLTKRADTQQKKTDKEKADKELQEQAIKGMKKENGGTEPIQATDN